MIRLLCAHCKAALTRSCTWAPFSAFATHVEFGESLLGEGTLVQWDVEDAVPVYYGDGRPNGKKVYSEPGAISANPADVLIEQMASCGVDNGCCGSDGCDGDNRACLCGAVLGTQWSDCWTQAEMRFRADAVKVEDADKS
jgi:hypothetical protein